MFRLGDIVKLKKGHPCGVNEWRVLRTGVDIKLECMGCQRQVWIRRTEFLKDIRKIKNEEGKFITFER